MPMFGWLVKDNLGTTWRDMDFPQMPGDTTAWVQLVNTLEAHNRYLVYMALRYKSTYFQMPSNADCYAFHFNVEMEMSGGGQETKKYMVGTSIQGKLATIRDVDEDGITHFHLSDANKAILMKPSPLAIDA